MIKNMKYLILIIVATILSCEPNNINQGLKYSVFEFPVYNNEPLFEDEYLYEKQSKKCLTEKVNKIVVYHFDWNDNGIYKEYGVDYVGVKSSLENRPTIIKLDTINSIGINGINYVLKIQESGSDLSQDVNLLYADLSLINELTPMILGNGKNYYPEIRSDSTVIYFWATWCRPCIETLKNINVQKLSESGVKLIPIAYNCSGSKEFLKENNLNFEDLIISEMSAEVYNIKSMPKQYTIFKSKEVSNNNVNLKRYCN